MDGKWDKIFNSHDQEEDRWENLPFIFSLRQFIDGIPTTRMENEKIIDINISLQWKEQRQIDCRRAKYFIDYTKEMHKRWKCYISNDRKCEKLKTDIKRKF